MVVFLVEEGELVFIKYLVYAKHQVVYLSHNFLVMKFFSCLLNYYLYFLVTKLKLKEVK